MAFLLLEGLTEQAWWGCWQKGFWLRYVDAMEMGSTGRPVSPLKNNFTFLFSSVTIRSPRVTRGPGSLLSLFVHPRANPSVSHSVNMRCGGGMTSLAIPGAVICLFIFMIIPLVSFSSSLLTPGFKVLQDSWGKSKSHFWQQPCPAFISAWVTQHLVPKVFF